MDETRIRDISPEVLNGDGRLRVLPAAFWARTTAEERALFGHRHGIYSFPTVELVEHLARTIDGHSAIEIGAGHGVLAEALGIPATDNRMQEKTPYRQVYQATHQPAVRYGPNVIDCDASDAVRWYNPEIVIGCWVTHKYDPAQHGAGGNEIGVDEDDILGHCRAYVLIGNAHVHRHKVLWCRPHHVSYPSFLYSRAGNGSREFIASWVP